MGTGHPSSIGLILGRLRWHLARASRTDLSDIRQVANPDADSTSLVDPACGRVVDGGVCSAAGTGKPVAH